MMFYGEVTLRLDLPSKGSLNLFQKVSLHSHAHHIDLKSVKTHTLYHTCLSKGRQKLEFIRFFNLSD